MKWFTLFFCVVIVSPIAMAKSDSSSRLIYEFLGSKGLEVWRDENGGYIQMQTFSCNSTYLKDIKILRHRCWYSALKNGCQTKGSIDVTDESVTKGFYEAMTRMGLPILSTNDSSEKWSQIDADGLNCMMVVDHTTDPASKDYTCWAMKKLKN